MIRAAASLDTHASGPVGCFEMLELAADPGLNLLTFTADPGSKSDEALTLLGSWAATVEREQIAPTAGEA